MSGTPGYMAPEILMKKGHDFSVDMYALGVILHEFILGKRPYPGRSRKEVICYVNWLVISYKHNFILATLQIYWGLVNTQIVHIQRNDSGC